MFLHNYCRNWDTLSLSLLYLYCDQSDVLKIASILEMDEKHLRSQKFKINTTVRTACKLDYDFYGQFSLWYHKHLNFQTNCIEKQFTIHTITLYYLHKKNSVEHFITHAF
jgi:hypothetical protein